MQLDHLAVVCSDLKRGTAFVEAALGVTMQAGGQHAAFGTHNTLLGLGEGLYLEVICPDPTAPPLDRPRWFDLDRAPDIPCLGNWIARVPKMAEALSQAPAEVGVPHALSRGDLRWALTVPDDGSVPMGGGYPTLIEWQCDPHPSQGLSDQGVRLDLLTITHPDAAWLTEKLQGVLDDPRVEFVAGAATALAARFTTPGGLREI